MGQPTTLWAHVWNLGRGPVVNARVEFYWCNPSLGIYTETANLIGVAYVDLGDRESGRCHTFVKCPITWTPSLENNGHQCLVARVFEPLIDPLPSPGWLPSMDRHVGQRNISVLRAASPARGIIPLQLGCSSGQGEARLKIERVSAASVPWLSILAANQAQPYREAQSVRELVGLLPVTFSTRSENRISPSLDRLVYVAGLLRKTLSVERKCDELETQCVVEVDGLEPGECCAYRITQYQQGVLLGGYTIIAHRPMDS